MNKDTDTTNKEMDDLKKEHAENEISDKEFEEKKNQIAMKAKPKTGSSNDPQLKILKTIRNLLIALIAVVVIGIGSAAGYIIYTNVSYNDDWYYDDTYYDDESGDEEGELSEEGEVAY